MQRGNECLSDHCGVCVAAGASAAVAAAAAADAECPAFAARLAQQQQDLLSLPVWVEGLVGDRSILHVLRDGAAGLLYEHQYDSKQQQQKQLQQQQQQQQLDVLLLLLQQ